MSSPTDTHTLYLNSLLNLVSDLSIFLLVYDHHGCGSEKHDHGCWGLSGGYKEMGKSIESYAKGEFYERDISVEFDWTYNGKKHVGYSGCEAFDLVPTSILGKNETFLKLVGNLSG